MDEPLLGPNSSRKCTRKSEHPFLNLICDSPRRKSGRFDPSSPRSVQPRSPSSFQPSSPISFQSSRPRSFQSDDQGKRPECCVGSAPSPRFVPNELPSGSSSFRGPNELGSRASGFRRPSVLAIPDFSGFGGALHRIPEESHVTGEPPKFSNAQAQVRDDGPDLEASMSPQERNRGCSNPVDGVVKTSSAVSAEPPVTVDGDEAEGEKPRWTSEVTGFLCSAIPFFQSIPDVIQALSSSPEHDVLDCPACESSNDDNEPEEQQNVETAPERFGTAELFGSPRRSPHKSSLSDITNLSTTPFYDTAPELPPVEFSRGDSEAGNLLSPDGSSLLSKSGKWTRKHIHRCRTAPLLTGLGKLQPKVQPGNQPAKTPKQTASSVVWQASMGLCIYLAVGVTIYTWKKDEFRGIETVGMVDALYFCIVTMCTIGYGDITPITPSAKMLSCGLMFVGFGFIDALLSGMVTFVLDRQESFLLAVVEDGHHERAKNYFMDSKKGRMRIRMKVALAVGTVFMTIIIGVLFLRYMESLNWVDSLYVACISITTVGYGDYSFQTTGGRLFAAVWLLLSTLGVARAFLFLAEARVHRRHRQLAKRILERKMTTTDLMAMDLDNDGHVSKSEFVVYKLKEMGRIQEKDILEICKQFDVLDNMDSGKITLAQLLDGNG